MVGFSVLKYAKKKRKFVKYSETKQLRMAVISLLLAGVTLATSTFCWFTTKISVGKTNDNKGIVFETDNGLRMNDVEKSLEHLLDNAFLIPASSVDGRNIYFPADGTDFSTTTEAMTFRNANSGDKNFYYLQYDFYLTAEEDDTSIYIKNGNDTSDNRPFTDICFHSEVNKPASERTKSRAIRAAIYYDGIKDNKPIVFNTQNRSVTTDAVDTIDRTDGSFMATSVQTSVSFKDYMYGKKILATLDRGETRRFSLIIWIEGTDENCTSDLIGETIDMKIDFTTSWDFTDDIIFQDNTQNNSIKTLLNDNPGYTLVLDYSNTEKNIDSHYFTMYKYKENGVHNNKWIAKIPRNAVNDIEFRIVDENNEPVTSGGITYRWKVNEFNRSTLNRYSSTKYIADGYKAISGANTPYGHWYDGEIEEGGEGRDDGDNGVNDDDW